MKPEKEPKKKPGNDPYGCDNPEDIQIKSCSATDCTGLIPALPGNQDELEAYQELYPFISEENL